MRWLKAVITHATPTPTHSHMCRVPLETCKHIEMSVLRALCVCARFTHMLTYTYMHASEKDYGIHRTSKKA